MAAAARLLQSVSGRVRAVRMLLLAAGALLLSACAGMAPAAFGNSDGDIAMLETTTNSPDSKRYPRLAALVWHTDATREYAYDRNTSVGRLDKGLTLAPHLGWHLIDMKRDWKVIFPYELR